jgi:7-cyano-7-deazaguanine synthase in queuosine biosynthesis
MRYPSEPRWGQEDLASQKIVEYALSIRDFTYTTSRLDFGFRYYSGRDTDTHLLVGSKIAKQMKKKVAIALGRQNDDMLGGTFEMRDKNKIAQRMWKSFCNYSSHQSEQLIHPEILLPLIELNVGKKEMMKQMPKELLALTWSCRKPVKTKDRNIETCGRCHSCKDIKAALNS